MEIGFHTFPSGKQYVFFKETESSRPCFLRNILFLTPPGDPHTVAIVREYGARTHRGVWEPPKGQMEWKEFAEAGVRAGSKLTAKQLTQFQRAGILREMVEEAKVLPKEIHGLTKLPLLYRQQWIDDYKPRGFTADFCYQFWHATCSLETLLEAQRRMAVLVDNPDWKQLLPADITEKDAIQWWNPDRDGWDAIRGAFSKKMTQLYFRGGQAHPLTPPR
ncbi:MAG: hypothetical protein EBU92_11370 [Betaproteobacteria bacterium]|nr:hypothetical protein [Betaproteobacteria bacterium]